MEATLFILLGAAAPFLVAIISRVGWSSTTKQLVAWGIAIVLGIVWVVLTGGFGAGFTFESFVAAVPIIYALSQAVYEFMLKNVLGKLEAATDKSAVVISPAPGHPENVVVTSNETIQVATKDHHIDANVEVEAPLEVHTTDNEPRG